MSSCTSSFTSERIELDELELSLLGGISLISGSVFELPRRGKLETHGRSSRIEFFFCLLEDSYSAGFRSGFGIAAGLRRSLMRLRWLLLESTRESDRLLISSVGE